ncbi:rpa-1 [Pristionchus pacificus]|uniref:Replication protein A subunit n=1 Tax=Pristionchus pacificus TaxID=54126 RepID=A0A2A6CQU5_PRIPA|nr:rpa-1 [Pristionchus pacificus]|eukprot:PDM80466.1 rpa-1 [Pristionchus pacificus]
MATDACQKYIKDGKLTLSTGCINTSFIELNEASENAKIIQIINYKEDKNKKVGAFKAKIIDGAFAFHPVFFHESLAEQLVKDGIVNGAVNSENSPIIATYSLCPSNMAMESNRLPLMIKSYELLYTNCPALESEKSNLIKYSGDPEDHKGFDKTKITPVFIAVNGGVKTEKTEAPPTTISNPSIPIKVVAPLINKPIGMATRGAPPPMKTNSSGSSNQSFTPISAITPYASKWRIKGVVTSKEEMRTVKMKSGESKVFNFDVCDDKNSTIKCVAFGDVAERTYLVVQENQMLAISGCGVRQANKRFNNTGHEYELSINATSEVAPLKDGPVIVVQYELKNRVKLDELPRKVGESVDVLACIDKVNELNAFTSKNGGNFVKREVSLIDQTGVNINFVLWGDQAKNFPEHTEGQPLGIKGVFVKEFNGGLTLGTTGSTKYVLTPDVDGMAEMCEWYNNSRGTVQTQSLSTGNASEGSLGRDLRLLGTASALQLGRGEQVYMNVKGRIMSVKGETAIYKSCPSENCSKKVIENEDGYRCDKCNISGDKYKFTYMLQMEIADMTGQIWITMFGKNAEQFMGMTAEELAEIKNENPSEYEDIFHRLKFATRIFRIRAKSEVYNDEERIKYNAFTVDVPDYNKLNPILDTVIDRLNALPI